MLCRVATEALSLCLDLVTVYPGRSIGQNATCCALFTVYTMNRQTSSHLQEAAPLAPQHDMLHRSAVSVAVAEGAAEHSWQSVPHTGWSFR